MNIELEFRLTSDDLYEFQRAHGKIAKMLARKKEGLFTKRMVGWAVILAITILMFITLHLSPAAAPVATPTPEPSPLFSFLPYLFVFLILWYFFFRRRMSKSHMRKVFEQQPDLSEQKSIALTSESITIVSESMSSTMKWNHFIHFDETQNLFLLFISNRSAHLLPKRAFTSTVDVDTFRKFAQAHVGNKPIGFPVQAVTPRREDSPFP